MPVGLFTSEMSAGVPTPDWALYLPIVPEAEFATKMLPPDTASAEGPLKPVMKEALTKPPAELYLATVPARNLPRKYRSRSL